MNAGYTDAAVDIHRREMGQYTAEEIVRNFYGLCKRKEVDDKGSVIEVDDDMHSDQALRKAGVYDYYLLHREALERYGVSEEMMLRLFPYVPFNQKAITAPPETPIEGGLPSVSGDLDEGGETLGSKPPAKYPRHSTPSTKA